MKICASLGIIIPKTAEPLENETFAFNQQHISRRKSHPFFLIISPCSLVNSVSFHLISLAHALIISSSSNITSSHFVAIDSWSVRFISSHVSIRGTDFISSPFTSSHLISTHLICFNHKLIHTFIFPVMNSIITHTDLYVYIYMYIYVYICIYMCIYIDICICIYTYIYMYMCIYVNMYICKYVNMYICKYVYMYICKYVYMYICIYVHMYICIYVYMICEYVSMYIQYLCMYICMHMAVSQNTCLGEPQVAHNRFDPSRQSKKEGFKPRPDPPFPTLQQSWNSPSWFDDVAINKHLSRPRIFHSSL